MTLYLLFENHSLIAERSGVLRVGGLKMRREQLWGEPLVAGIGGGDIDLRVLQNDAWRSRSKRLNAANSGRCRSIAP